jgi:predicted phage tail protein
VRQYDTETASWLAAAESTNPAWIYHWLLTDCPAVQRRLADERVDTQGIAEWAAECDAKGYKIGFVMDSGRALGDVLRDVLAAGRASFGLRNSLYSAVRDLAQTVPVQMFTPANSWGFNYSRQFGDLPHALRVKFTNPEASYQQDIRLVYWDGYSEDGGSGTVKATLFEELDLSMVIDPDAAWMLGRYHLAVIWNRMTQYKLNADIEHMVCERGDLVHVAHDITSWGIAWGRVKAISGSTVTLDGPVTLESGKTYAFRIRKDTAAEAS